MAIRFVLAVFVGSALLFLAEPMCAKMVLPLLGGTPAVWNTCMVFFQVGLLAGYAYAHYLPNCLGLRGHAVVHLAALALAVWTLPLAMPATVPDGWHPVLWLLLALTWRVGLPFVLVSANAPLLQRWLARGQSTGARDPYFLYAASNLGSFAGLVSYPFLVEPALTLSEQGWLWSIGYAVLFLLVAICFPAGRHQPTDAAPLVPEPPADSWARRLRWGMLALIPSSLTLSVTTYLTTDLAPVPLLWIVPIGIYLGTYVLAFAGRPILPQAVVLRWTPLAVLVAIVVRLLEASEPLAIVVAVHLLVLGWLALACHTELARDRPAAGRLTEFYLCLAVGGAAGSVFNGLVAPLVFMRLTEYPLMLLLAALLCGRPAPWTRGDLFWAIGLGGSTAGLILAIQAWRPAAFAPGPGSFAIIFAVPLLLAYMGHASRWRFALGMGAILLASALYHGIQGDPVFRARSFFGAHLVADRDGMRRLVHGRTVHGMERLGAGGRGLPLTYYHPTGPIGDVMRALHGDGRLDRVALVGLGTGSLAYYAAPDQQWTFFEIDPAVIQIARDPHLFTFLRDARGGVDVVEGDGRLCLEAATDDFGLIVLDAFGSDAIPLHLLTREALAVYSARLRPRGLLAFHISNNYLDLEPVLANLAREAQPPLRCYIRADRTLQPADRRAGKFPSVWAVLAHSPADLPRAVRTHPWRPARPRDDLAPWTDAYSNIWQVFQTAPATEP